jgi:hypothetical protein
VSAEFFGVVSERADDVVGPVVHESDNDKVGFVLVRIEREMCTDFT